MRACGRCIPHCSPEYESARSRLCFGNHALDALFIPHIQLQRNRAPPQASISALNAAATLASTAGEHQVRAGFCQRPRKVLPQAAAGSGHNRHLSRQIEQRVYPITPPESAPLSSGSAPARAAAQTSCGPSSSGATAVISGFTLILPIGNHLDRLRIFSRRSARSLQAQLPLTTFCSGNRHFRRDVSDQRYRAAFARRIRSPRSPSRFCPRLHNSHPLPSRRSVCITSAPDLRPTPA